jgi:hypothetical protein
MKIRFMTLCLFFVLLQGCGSLGGMLSTGSSWKTASEIHSGIDLLSQASTGKSTTDHFLSNVNDKDCKVLRTLKAQPICREQAQYDF